jgi:hypothetical protein
MVSGLYCKGMIFNTAEVVGSSRTMPPLRVLGERGEEGMDFMFGLGSRSDFSSFKASFLAVQFLYFHLKIVVNLYR